MGIRAPFLLLALLTAAWAQAPLVRPTPYGPVKGLETGGTYAWKGIPFAKPPVGALRWHAPVEPEAWTGPRDATAFGPASIQVGRIFGPGRNNTFDATIAATLEQPVGSEDSLTLNIWRPATDQAGLPVICFIHGGSNISGYSADPGYDGAALARGANAVVVTGNYRLGPFGWLGLRQLRDPADPLGASGNFGTLDQIQTLKFINRAIGAFGGDPGNVTVLGQSAGAVDTYALLTSPLLVKASPRLIHRAVLLSGGLALDTQLPPGGFPTLRSASFVRAQGSQLLLNLLTDSGVAKAASWVRTHTDAEVAAFLRAQSPEAILRQARTLGGVSHMPDGVVVAEDPIAAIRAGAYLKVPVIVGTTRDEGKLFPAVLAASPLLGGRPGLIVDDATRFRMMLGFDCDAPASLTVKDLIDPAYLPAATPDTGFNARTALVGHSLFTLNRDAMLEALKASQKEIWVYRFDWDREPAPWDVVYGAAHAFDLPFLFGNFGPSLMGNVMGGNANRKGRLALSEAMMGALGAFARGGDPNHPRLGVTWPVWPGVLLFDATLTERRLTVQ